MTGAYSALVEQSRPIVLKRGMLYGDDEQSSMVLWDWIQGVINGLRTVARYDGIVRVRGSRPAGGTAPFVASRVFDRGLPLKVVVQQLNAKSGDVAIEELHIAHEGLRMQAS